MKSLPREVGRGAGTITSKGYGMMQAFQIMRSIIDSLQEEYPSIPSDSDEAAKEFAKTTFKKPYSDNPDEEVTIVEPDKYAGFIAGAKWDREQMMKEAVEYEVGMHGEPIKITFDKYVQRARGIWPGDKVRIIIVKED